jgi:UDP-N-acetyl-D-mannosaminuronate dehydrogenase
VAETVTRPRSPAVTVGVVGLGYVGLPLAVAFGEAGLDVISENTSRAVNIALVNELAILADRMGVDIWRLTARSAGALPENVVVL